MTTFRRVAIANSGLVLTLLSDGAVVIQKNVGFTVLYEACQLGVTGVFALDGFTLVSKEVDHQDFDYGVTYYYKETPILKQWLEQQNLLWSEQIF